MTVEFHKSNPFGHLPHFDSKTSQRAARRVLDFHGMLDHADANVSGFVAGFARQLEYVYPEVERLVFSQLKARTLIPVDTSVPNWAETFTYRQMGEIQRNAAIALSYTDDAPQPELYANEFPQRIFSLTSAYGYSIQDMRAAAELNIQLDAEKGRMARQMIERSIEDLAAFGTPLILQPGGSQQVYGLTNAPNVTATTQISSGTWIAQYNADTSDDKTASKAAMLADLAAMRQQIFNNTKGEMGQLGTLSVVFPTKLYSFLENVPRSIKFDSTGQNLLEYLVKTAGYKDASYWNRLDLANSGGTGGRTMVYRRDPQVLRLIIAQEFEQFAPQPRNLGFIIPCHARTGAVEVRRPLEMTFMDGISP